MPIYLQLYHYPSIVYLCFIVFEQAMKKKKYIYICSDSYQDCLLYFLFTWFTTDHSWLLRYHQRLSFGPDKHLCNINKRCLLFLSLYLGCATRSRPNKGLPLWTEAAFRGECEGFLAPFLLGSCSHPSCLEAPEEQMAWHHPGSPVSACLLGLSFDPRLAVSPE